MADAHHDEEIDPNAAPMHLEVRENFPAGAYAFAFGLGGIALVVGLILGLALTVD
jgi:hypothetical protein